MRPIRLCVAGGGKMAEALTGGLISSGWASPSEMGIIEISEQRREFLAERFPQTSVVSSAEEAASTFGFSDVLVAVKPQHVAEVGRDLAGAGVGRVLSIAAGVRITAIQAAFGGDTVVVRSMPNTPALVGQGAAGIAGSANASAEDLEWASSILGAVGKVVAVQEQELDAVTGVSGSGPAYLFLMAEAMTAAGIQQGLSPEVSDVLTRQTLLGAATLLSSSGETPEQLRANVTSPGGTTNAAIVSMQAQGLPQAVIDGIDAAVKRSIELGSDS